MSEESRMPIPPPPPPNRSSKPVPPPPPGRGGTPPPPPMGGVSAASPAPVVPAPGKSAPAPIPFPPGGTPVGAMPPGMPAPARSAPDPRLAELERKLQEQEEARKKLEEKSRDLESKYKDEHEKLILQSLKAKEEESLSVRVDQQLREMQEKLRREKYEQELQESRGKAETQLKDLERRIAEERETWMTALKNQLKEREAIEREVEDNLTRRLRDMEQRYMEDKNQWTLAMKQKAEELNQQRHHFELELEKWKEVMEDRDEEINRLKEQTDEDRHKADLQHQAEYRALQAQFEAQMREVGSWKAQLAMVQSQNQQLELQQQQERNRAEGQIRVREEDVKREYAMRDQERTQYWEGAIAQLRAEKESLRAAIARGEDEAARYRDDFLETKRELDKERSEWQATLEKARRLAREEAVHDLPEIYEQRMAKERKTLGEEHSRALQGLHHQLTKAHEATKALSAKFEIEQRRWEQQRTILHQSNDQLQQAKASLAEELKKLKEDFEKQTKELFHHIAESQMKESSTRDEMARQKETLDTAMAASLQEAYTKDDQIRKLEAQLEDGTSECNSVRTDLGRVQDELNSVKAEMVRLRSELSEKQRLTEEARAREELMKNSQSQLTTAFHNVQGELVKLKEEHSQRRAEWLEKQSAWTKAEQDWEAAKAEWQRTKIELEKTPKAPPVLSADAQRALSAIRQHMQELRTLLAGLRP